MKSYLGAAAFAAQLATVYAAGGLLETVKNKNGNWVAELETGKVELRKRPDMVYKSLWTHEKNQYKFCDDDTGEWRAMTTPDGKYASCCPDGMKLFNSEDIKTFMCCPTGHEMQGSPDKSAYTCCPTGQVYDGTQCVTAPVKCEGGKELVNGRCVCPKGTYEKDYVCVQKAKCDSGLQTGKCYTFTAETGKRYGFSNDPAGYNYCPDVDSAHHRYGKFQLCNIGDKDCTPGLPIDPDTGIHIRDWSGEAYTGARAGLWLNGANKGGHISKTAVFAEAGKFTLSKWPCGKYCWSGFPDQGLGPTCPSVCVGISFWPDDKQSCIPITILEIPCDIRDPGNNCLWDSSGNQCCSPDGCAAGMKRNFEEGEKFAQLTGLEGQLKVKIPDTLKVKSVTE